MEVQSAIVVGAGIAGLTAAYELMKRGVNVTVLEAAGRVGGRMRTDRRDGYLIDCGAQFLSDGYAVLGALAHEHGLAPQLRHANGWTGIVRGGTVRRFLGQRPWSVVSSGLLGWRAAAHLARGSLTLALRSRRLPLSDYARWHALDDEEAAAWIARAFGREALEYLFEPMLEGFYFQAPEGMSRAWPAAMWSFGARGHGATALAGGIGSLPEALARRLDVRLATPAESVDSDSAGVRVTTPAGVFHADCAVLATPAPATRRVYAPGHPLEAELLSTGYSATVNVSLAVPAGLPAGALAADLYGLLIPRRERQAIAAVAFESHKCQQYVPQGELLNVMLSGAAGARLVSAPDDAVLAEVLPELERYVPGVGKRIAFAHISRWSHAEPRSPVGRSRALRIYRQQWRRDTRVALAGDYMGIPCTEGAAQSGQWAARALLGAPGDPPEG